MSAIGSYIRMTSADFARCVDLASRRDAEAFDRAWRAAVIEEVDFDFSGYVLSDFFLAQEAINGYAESPFDTNEGQVLASVFTAAFPIRSATVSFPKLAPDALRTFCAEEYGNDAEPMATAIAAADAFYERGIAAVRNGEVVVFLIS